MFQNPLISIVIPTFNSDMYLRRCMDSILNQSIKNFEVIAVDDLSTDNTVKILRSYESSVPHMRVVELQKKGFAGGARNVGLRMARGKYVSFVDSDDWIDTNFYYHLVHAIENRNADISLCGVKREYENAKNSIVRYRYEKSNIISGRYALSLLSRVVDQDISISAIVCNKLFKRSFIVKNNLYFVENCINEDDIFTFNSFLEADRVSITSECKYHLHQRKNSASRSFSKRNIDDLFLAFLKIREVLNAKGCFYDLKNEYYSFFEKCFSFVIESMQNAVQDDELIKYYFKYAYSVACNTFSSDEFIDCFGSKRLIAFFAA